MFIYLFFHLTRPPHPHKKIENPRSIPGLEIHDIYNFFFSNFHLYSFFVQQCSSSSSWCESKHMLKPRTVLLNYKLLMQLFFFLGT